MEIKSREIKIVDIDSIIPNPKNPNTHSKEQIERLCKLIKNTGFRNPLVVSNQSGFLVVGHGRLEAAKSLKMTQIPVLFQDFKNEADEYAYMTADNAIGSWSELDLAKISEEAIKFEELDIEMLGIKDFEVVAEEKSKTSEARKNLRERFVAPPFSVLDSKAGEWIKRKEMWKSLGISSEDGRDVVARACAKTFKNCKSSKSESMNESTSVFDPVLCEIAYSWFSPPDGIILDCFSGGSVRGIVASILGRKYVGVDLRQEQVDANNSQLDLVGENPAPNWICGDSRNIDILCKDVKADMIFSCPPYADLEVYSDNPKDLSTMEYEDFKSAYFEIIKKSCDLLKNDSFACFVVGEVRNKKGNYYNFVGDTIQAFKDAGLEYYNEIIFCTMIGNTSLTSSRNFPIARKVGKVHQNVLVFVKGDPKLATKRCGEIEVREDAHTDEPEL